MKKELILIGIFTFCIAYKFFSNCYRQRKTVALKKKYEDWIKDQDSVNDIVTYKYEIIELFKVAKVKNIIFPVSIPVGNGTAANSKVNLFENLFQRRADIAASVLDAFDSAIGYYRTSKRKAISLLYWIEVIIFLPKKIIEYTGVDLEKTSSKVTNLILTAIWWFIGCLFTLYKAEIIALFQSLLEKIAQ